jgi:hypothetical protein
MNDGTITFVHFSPEANLALDALILLAYYVTKQLCDRLVRRVFLWLTG